MNNRDKIITMYQGFYHLVHRYLMNVTLSYQGKGFFYFTA